jgi:hypothetical protein
MPKDIANASGAAWDAHIKSCVDHWSVALAGSPDSPYAVVDAVMHVCGDDLSSEAGALNEQAPNIHPNVDAILKKLSDDDRGEAIRVIEAFRKAKCKGPNDPHSG